MTWQDKIKHLNKPELMQGEYICRCADALGIVPKHIVEIGVYKGMTSKVFRDWFPSSQLILVDPWTHQDSEPSKMYKKNSILDWEDIYDRVCKDFQHDIGTHILRCPSSLASIYTVDDLDIIFVDGSHSYDGVMSDLKHWTHKMARPCLITGHDYNHSGRHKGVGQAVDEFFGKDAVVVGPRKTWIYYGK